MRSLFSHSLQTLYIHCCRGSKLSLSPANQQAWVQANIDKNAAGSTIMQQISEAPSQHQSGTYPMYFEYCEPKNGDKKGVFQTHHGIVGNAAYWNVVVG